MKKMSFIYIVLASVLWGTSGIFVHYLAPFGFTSLHMTCIRSAIAFLSVFLYIFISKRELFKVSVKEITLFSLGGVSFFGTASCYFYSMQATSISTAVVLMYTAPIFVMIYSVLFLGEKLTKIKTVSVALMIVGCALVSGVIGGLKFDIIGVVFGFLSGILYSAYNIITKINMQNKSNPISANFYGFLAALIVALMVCNPGEIPSLAMQKPAFVLPLMLELGVVTCILPYFLYTLALRVIPAGTASSLGIIEPMSATVFSVLLFNEKLSIFSTAGMILILVAVYLLSKNEE